MLTYPPDHPRQPGRDDSDYTSYLESQRSWGENEADRPEILYRFRKLDYRDPDYELTDWICPWIGQTIRKPNPAGGNYKAYRDLPQQLSSNVEGWLLEAICRTDDRIGLDDLCMRIRPSDPNIVHFGQMPKSERARQKNNLQMLKWNFRQDWRMISWSSRWGTDRMVAFTERELTPWQLQNNTTRGAPMRTKAERKAYNVYRRMMNARDRAYKHGERKKRAMSGLNSQLEFGQPAVFPPQTGDDWQRVELPSVKRRRVAVPGVHFPA